MDWAGQGDWMLGTTVRVIAGDGASVGSRVVARTGVGPFGVRDLMEITAWVPPHRCEVRHLGRVVRGGGVFEVRPAGTGAADFVWTERLDLPLGAVGRLGWPLVRPLFTAGVRESLRRFAARCEGRP
jgi:hypothetical protein